MIKPYYKTDLGVLYHGDCLEIMPELEPVDLVLTSPQYNLGNPKKGSMYNNVEGERLSYCNNTDNLPYPKYIEQQHIYLKAIYKTLTDNGAIFYNHKPRIIKGIFDNKRNLIPFPVRQEIIWDRVSMTNFNGSFFATSTERIFIIAKPKWKPIKEYVKLGEVWRFPVTPSTDPSRANHPAPFPLALANTVVLAGGEPNSKTLDPFMGSGTTAIACERLNRRWIGIEIEEKYCEIAAKRIEKERSQLKLW